MAERDPALLAAVRRRSRALKRDREERDTAIREASEGGFSLREIGAEADVSFQAIAKILQRARVNGR